MCECVCVCVLCEMCYRFDEDSQTLPLETFLKETCFYSFLSGSVCSRYRHSVNRRQRQAHLEKVCVCVCETCPSAMWASALTGWTRKWTNEKRAQQNCVTSAIVPPQH